MRKLLGLIAILTLCFGTGFAQTRPVTGTVVNGDDGTPVVGAVVSVVGTSTVSVSNVEGHFSINASPDATLSFSSLDFESQQVVLGGRTTVDVRMTRASTSIEQVVVVGFGTQKKVNLTGAITAVGSDTFENRPVTNVGQALQGVIPNLNVGISNGAPNTVPSFSIRGTATISYSNGAYNTAGVEPLILVDGVDVTSTQVNQMNPNDIESMSVIKDASAAAIYGTKATFGVILITTKSGKFNQKGTIGYSYDLSWDTPSALPDIMNAREIQNFVINNEQWTSVGGRETSQLNLNKLAAIEKFMADPTNPENRYIMNGNSIVWTGNMNPYEMLIRDWTPTQKHNFNVSGGTDRVAYYLSAGYLTQEGMYKIGKDDYKRYNVSARFNAKVTPWFNVETKFSYNRNMYDQPYVPSYKGSIWSVLKQDADKNINMPIQTLASDPAGVQWTDNYLAWLDYGNRQKSQSWTTVMTVSPEVIILPEVLKVKADISYTPQGTSYRRVSPKHYYHTFTWAVISEQQEYKENRGRLEKGTTDNFQMNVYADFNKTFAEKHNLSAIAGFYQDYVDYSMNIINMRNLFSANILNPGAVEDQTLNTAETSAQTRTARAAFGRINYNYAGKYLFEVNGRYDGSSKFTKDGRFFFFPSFSVGWRISEEKFMDFARGWMDNLKFRFSYGQLGSQPGGYYPYQATMSSGSAGYWLDGEWLQTVYAPGLGSASLTWEKAATTNFGIDGDFLNNRLNVSLDIYTRKTTDILVTGNTAYPNILGTGAPLENSGAIRTRGFELTLGWQDRLANGLRYNAGVTLSDAMSKVLNYPSNEIKSLGTLYSGMTVGQIWGYETGGILQKEDLVANGNSYIFYGPRHSGNLWPGDPWLKDLNGDGVINTGSNTLENPGDRRVIGNSTARYRFGVTLGASWKGFDLNMLFQGVAKRDSWISSTTYWGGGTNNAGSRWMYERSWKPDQTDAKFPRYSATAGGPAAQTGWLVNSAYLRMKQLILGYTLPTALTGKWNIDKLRFSVSAYNLFEITQVPTVFDVDQISDAYPQKRTIAFGAQITF